jgi:hypothetical protein
VLQAVESSAPSAPTFSQVVGRHQRLVQGIERASTNMSSHELQVILSKVRPHTSSNVAHQRKRAQLLVALESTIQSTSGSTSVSSPSSSTAIAIATPTASAYFAALITTLQGTPRSNKFPFPMRFPSGPSSQFFESSSPSSIHTHSTLRVSACIQYPCRTHHRPPPKGSP